AATSGRAPTPGSLTGSNPGSPDPNYLPPDLADAYDPLPRRNRRILAVISSIVLAMGAGLFVNTHVNSVRVFTPIFVFASVWGGTAGFLLAMSRLLPTMAHESKWGRRFALTTSIAAGAFLLGGIPFLGAVGSRSGFGTWAALLVTTLLMDS